MWPRAETAAPARILDTPADLDGGPNHRRGSPSRGRAASTGTGTGPGSVSVINGQINHGDRQDHRGNDAFGVAVARPPARQPFIGLEGNPGGQERMLHALSAA
jgi:hypothetical protein